MRLTKLTIFFTCALLFFIWGCSTTNHAKLATQAFMDITSHYNAYFNANEKLKSTFKLSLDSHKDKFDSVIPVFYYGDPKEFAAYTSDLDDIIKRSTLAIQLRPISNWSDDHFLLIGIANYLKGDYDKASSSFKFITTEYKEGVDYVKVMHSLDKKLGKYVRKKPQRIKPEIKVTVNKDGTQTLDKVDKRPSFSIWVHAPARSEALLWLIKTYSRQKKFTQAASVVTYVRGDDMFYRNLDPQLDLVEADLDVAKKDYAAAITPLENYLNAKSIQKKKRLRGRPLFVLAQCYEMTGNKSKAIENYKLVLQSRPNYDMEFYAKLKMAKLARGSNDDNKEILKLLISMTKDKKYSDYYDQVYYELALISLSQNNRAEARKFLHKSVNYSTTNDDQHALSYQKLAQLDFDEEQYVSSKFFYDSTLNFMAKNDSRYLPIKDTDRILTNLVTQLTTISTEDSLQKLAKLPKDQRDRIIRAAIARKEAEEEAKKNALNHPQNFLYGSNQNPNQKNPNGSQANQSWYFYNTVARAQGFNDFTKKWGRRKLEENWRRKDKSSVSPSDDDSENASDSTQTDTAKANKGTPEEQMEAAIPTDSAKLEASNNKLIDAYYTAGTIYKDELESYPKAENMFETLNSRFPKHKLLLESYYNLYLIAEKEKNASKAEEYKNKIFSGFPESVIAKVLKDPNYINEARRKEQEVFDYYQGAYNDYYNNDLKSAWYKCQMADDKFKPNPLSAKFDLLGALILAKQNRLSDYVQTLNKIINTSKDAEVKKTANDLLSALNKSSLPQIDLSVDTNRRDSLNRVYYHPAPDTSQNSLLKQLNEAKERAQKNNPTAKQTAVNSQQSTDKTSQAQNANSKEQATENSQAQNTNEQAVNAVDTASANSEAATDTAANNEVAEDTTSPYTRTDAAAHYFIVYIKDPATPQSAIMSVMAKISAFNSTQFEVRRFITKQSVLDSKNRVLLVRPFNDKADVMNYFNTIKTQNQLFDDLKPEQYAITCISVPNFGTLSDRKDVDEYNKFFRRVYK